MSRTPAVRCLLALLIVLVLGAACGGGGEGSDVARPPLRWLSAGDSFASAEGMPDTTRDCATSEQAHAVVARELVHPGIEIEAFTHVACSGAKLHDFDAQLAQARDGGGDRYELVNFSLGGNDIGYAIVLLDCFGADELLGRGEGFLDMIEADCDVTDEDLDRRVDELGEELAEFYRAAADSSLAPGGQLLVVGYPQLFEDPSRWPDGEGQRCDGIRAADVVRFRRIGVRLNETLRAATEATENVHFVDVIPSFEGHGRCSEEPWIHGIRVRPFKASHPLAGSFHPNQAGQAAMAEALAAQIRAVFGEAP